MRSYMIILTSGYGRVDSGLSLGNDFLSIYGHDRYGFISTMCHIKTIQLQSCLKSHIYMWACLVKEERGRERFRAAGLSSLCCTSHHTSILHLYVPNILLFKQWILLDLFLCEPVFSVISQLRIAYSLLLMRELSLFLNVLYYKHSNSPVYQIII